MKLKKCFKGEDANGYNLVLSIGTINMVKIALNKYKKPEDKLILSKVLDKINFCETKKQIQVTDFLDLAQQDLITKFMKTLKMENYILFGRL